MKQRYVQRALARASLFALSALCVSATATHARAYCRTHSLDALSSCPVYSCEDRGVPMAWRTAKLSYGFNQAGVPGLSDGQLRSTLAKSFQAWADVTCDGKSIGFEFTQLPGVTPLQDGPTADDPEPNENVITHYDAQSWADMDYVPQAFAVTSVWHDDAGVIAGADMDLNGGWDLFGDCEIDDCLQSSVQTDLQNVTTHEAGHFLGLAHSPVDGSTMHCDADPGAIDKRTLEQDDIDGLCAAYPPGKSFPADKSGGCSVTPGAAESWLAPVAFALLLGALARRRRVR